MDRLEFTEQQRRLFAIARELQEHPIIYFARHHAFRPKAVAVNSGENIFDVSPSYKLGITAIFSLLALSYYYFCIKGGAVILLNLQHAQKIEHILASEAFVWGLVYTAQSISQRVSLGATHVIVSGILSREKRSFDDIKGYLEGSGSSFPSPVYYYLLDRDFKCIFQRCILAEKI